MHCKTQRIAYKMCIHSSIHPSTHPCINIYNIRCTTSFIITDVMPDQSCLTLLVKCHVSQPYQTKVDAMPLMIIMNNKHYRFYEVLQNHMFLYYNDLSRKILSVQHQNSNSNTAKRQLKIEAK